MTEAQLEAALDLLRRLPPTKIEDSLSSLIDIAPDLTEALLSTVDQPLKVARDKSAKKDYLLCDYNRDGDSYRSPWSNTYDPKLKDGALPSERVRKMEIQANDTFDVYRLMYYEGGTSSVYMWDTETGFAACILFKKVGSTAKHGPVQGSWDSIHVVDVQEQGGRATYQLTSTVMLHLHTKSASAGGVSLAGNLTKQSESSAAVDGDASHVANIGEAIEAAENQLRMRLEVVYFSKTRDIVNSIRHDISERKRRDEVQGKVGQKLPGAGANLKSIK